MNEERNAQGKNALDKLVLQATNPLQPGPSTLLPLIRKQLKAGADASRTINFMVDLWECCFEAVEHDSAAYRRAVENSTAIIPMLKEAGAAISPAALSSARYNCAPTIQELLLTLPIKDA